MNAPSAPHVPDVGRNVLLAWVREHAPDLRIGYTQDEEGQRRAHARMTLGEEVVELEADDDLEIARVCYSAVRRHLGLDSLQRGKDDRTRQLEILEAALAQDPLEAKRLAKAYAQDMVRGVIPKTAIRGRFSI